MDNHHQRKDEEFSFDEQQAGFVMGAVVGALVGGAAALLLSPKSGKEMREVVKKYSKDLEQEAQELAKDARGTANSFKSVLQEGAVEVLEQAPEKIEQAGYQAQQLADELNHRFESARDVVAELAEAFRSGWEEYGEDQPEDELKAAPSLLTDEGLNAESPQKVAVNEESDSGSSSTPVKLEEFKAVEIETVKVPPLAPAQARRRTHIDSAYSMHSSPVTNKPEAKTSVDAAARPEPHKVKDEDAPKRSDTTSSYTTRILDEPKKIEAVKPRVKVEEAPAKKQADVKKKLLFRRSSK